MGLGATLPNHILAYMTAFPCMLPSPLCGIFSLTEHLFQPQNISIVKVKLPCVPEKIIY